MRTYRVMHPSYDRPEYREEECREDVLGISEEDNAEEYYIERVTYSCRGDVRGDCGHRHNTIDAAIRCSRADGRSCAALGGGAYSDRNTIVRHRPESESTVHEGDADYWLASEWSSLD